MRDNISVKPLGPLLVILLCISCDNTQSPTLPNGYSVFRSNSATTVICDPSEQIVVGPRVTALSRHGDYVIGLTESSPESEIAGEYKVGYFWINTKTGALKSGLQEDEWKEQLRVAQITNPTLRRL
jgi:hypothetical protein